MDSKYLKEYKEKLSKLSEQELRERDLYLRKLALGEIEGPSVGYASIDKPWLKNYDESLFNTKFPMESAYLRVLNANRDNMDKVALIYGDRLITYGEMFKNIDLVANSFIEMGIKEKDVVSVCVANIPEAVYVFYALNKLGAVCDFMDPRATMLVMKDHLNLANSKILVTISDCYPIFKELKSDTKLDTIISVDPMNSLKKDLDNEDKTILRENDLLWNDFLLYGVDKNYDYIVNNVDDPAAVLHTGGSTGEPKGALITNKNLNALVDQWLSCGIDYNTGDKLLSLMPPFVSFGLAANLHVPLVNSMKIILIPKYEPEKTVDLIKMYKPNCVPASPAHWEQVYLDPRSKDMDWSFLKVALMGGEILNPVVEKGLNKMFKDNNSSCKFVGAYGMTETTTALAMGFNKKVNLDGSVGAPLPFTTLSIIDTETGEDLGYNQIGEICALTPNMMLGYYGKEDETKEILKKHDDGKVWVHTGDLGYITEDGILFIKGRIKRIIIRYDGIKIYPIDIETKLYQNPLVVKTAVFGVRDENHLHGENPVAYVVLNNKDVNNYREKIEKYCEENLIDYSVPVDYVFIDELPYTRNGKVDYKKLKNDYKTKVLKK